MPSITVPRLHHSPSPRSLVHPTASPLPSSAPQAQKPPQTPKPYRRLPAPVLSQPQTPFERFATNTLLTAATTTVLVLCSCLLSEASHPDGSFSSFFSVSLPA
eukprot:CAMPEP_0182471156 /NCGR_PEP_ID=MMETSP1319-20130603/19815_1 /TAXON_ID=172717 /ORGANISM="Bolidomonas pacifica, Strain RCC208" /LENGTH=102 /DNA_ID=CAMNT_0024671677 /DNA_START=113 /DNA_END=418 /DNA_ORIENTATION=+